MNQRLNAQQGVFLCPGDINQPFMKNLLSGRVRASREAVVRVILPGSVKERAVRDLRRMNVTYATLFPDLSGFAMSLADWFHLPLNFRAKDLVAAIDGRFPGD